MTDISCVLLGGPGTSGIVEADETYWGANTPDKGHKMAKRAGFRQDEDHFAGGAHRKKEAFIPTLPV